MNDLIKFLAALTSKIIRTKVKIEFVVGATSHLLKHSVKQKNDSVDIVLTVKSLRSTTVLLQRKETTISSNKCRA